ncbi:MAG: hypothetical protein ACOC58_05555 [Chloroflexota bacterium]
MSESPPEGLPERPNELTWEKLKDELCQAIRFEQDMLQWDLNHSFTGPKVLAANVLLTAGFLRRCAEAVEAECRRREDAAN